MEGVLCEALRSLSSTTTCCSAQRCKHWQRAVQPQMDGCITPRANPTLHSCYHAVPRAFLLEKACNRHFLTRVLSGSWSSEKLKQNHFLLPQCAS